MFLVVSWSDVRFGFASNIGRPKSRAPRKNSVHPCLSMYDLLVETRY